MINIIGWIVYGFVVLYMLWLGGHQLSKQDRVEQIFGIVIIIAVAAVMTITFVHQLDIV